MLLHSRQTVENCGFSHIWISRQSYCRKLGTLSLFSAPPPLAIIFHIGQRCCNYTHAVLFSYCYHRSSYVKSCGIAGGTFSYTLYFRPRYQPYIKQPASDGTCGCNFNNSGLLPRLHSVNRNNFFHI